MAKTKEVHFEDAIENSLSTVGGWTKGKPEHFDRSLGDRPSSEPH
jgi:hypothetical protein